MPGRNTRTVSAPSPGAAGASSEGSSGLAGVLSPGTEVRVRPSAAQRDVMCLIGEGTRAGWSWASYVCFLMMTDPVGVVTKERVMDLAELEEYDGPLPLYVVRWKVDPEWDAYFNDQLDGEEHYGWTFEDLEVIA